MAETLEKVRLVVPLIEGMNGEAQNASFKEVFDHFLNTLEEKHRSGFESQQSPTGEAWRPLAPSTVKRKGHDTILFETGKLKASLTGKAAEAIRESTAKDMTFGTSVEYAGFHQRGTSTIPQRVHVGASENSLKLLEDGIADFIVDLMKR